QGQWSRGSLDRRKAYRTVSPDLELQECLLHEDARHVCLTPHPLNLRDMLEIPILLQTTHGVALWNISGETLTRIRDRCWRIDSLPGRSRRPAGLPGRDSFPLAIATSRPPISVPPCDRRAGRNPALPQADSAPIPS